MQPLLSPESFIATCHGTDRETSQTPIVINQDCNAPMESSQVIHNVLCNKEVINRMNKKRKRQNKKRRLEDAEDNVMEVVLCVVCCK